MSEASVSIKGSTDLSKILDTLKANETANITINVISKDALNKINEVRKELESIEEAKINLTLTGDAESKIQNLQQQLNNLNKQSAKQAKSQQRANRKSGGSAKKLEQSAGFPVSRRKWAQKYAQAASKEEQQVIQSLLGKNSTLVSASGRQRYDKTGKEIGSDWIVTYRDELGKTVKTMLQSRKEMDKTGQVADKWRVTGTAINANYEAQAKAQEKVQNYLNQQENSYKNLNSLAFDQKGALDRDSVYGKAAIEAIEKYNEEIQKVQGDNSLYNKDSRKKIEDARQEAQRVIKQQKALRDEERKQEAQDAKLEADQQKKIQAKQKQFDKIAEQGRKEEEQRQKQQADEVAKGQEYAYKSQQNWENQLKKAAEDRLKQEAAEKKAANQSYLSDLKKNSKQLEYEQKVRDNAQNEIANAQNELKLLEKSTFSGSKALTGDYAERARAEIGKVSGEFEKLKEAAGKSFSDAMNVSKDGLTASLKNLGAELDKLKGLQYPADKLAAKDVDTLKLDYGNKIQEFRDQLKGAGLETSDFATKLGDLEKSLQTVGKVDGSGTVWADWKAQFESLQASYEKFQASASGKGLKLAESIDVKQLGQIQDLIATLNNSTISGAGTEALKEELYSLETEYSNLMAQLQSGNLTDDQFTALSNGVKELDDRLKQAASSAKVLQDGFKNEQSIHKFQNNVEGLRNNFEKLERTYANIIEKNPEIAAKFEQLRAMFEQGQVDPINYAQVASDVSNLGKACSNAAGEASGLRGALQGAFGGVGQYLARFTSAFYIINKSIQTVKSMVNEVTQLDTSLMELQKVTTLSGDSLAQFTDNAYKTGKEVGRTGKDVIDAVTTFSRAGYNLEESNELAKAALTMTNVGVDIPNTEAAASDMISILRAFDKQANESMQVIDELYNVANKEPLDFGNITDMLVTAGGTLAQSGTSLEESMGLLTGAFATLRDPSVANGLIQISQRLRGVREDGEAIEEEGFMPKLKKAFGDVGVEIEDQNGELRSAYKILDDLAGVWDTLSSKQKQYLGEKAAGTRQVKVLNAIMANWDVVEDTIQKANEATGEATKGNEKYLDSIEGKITQFKSAFSDLSRTVINSDLVKFLVGAGTGFLNGLTSIAKVINGLFEPVGKAIGYVFDQIGRKFSTSYNFKAVAKDLSETKKEFEEQSGTVENLNAQLEDTQSRIEELNSKDTLTIVEQTELDRLQDLNKELEATLQLEQARANIKQNELRLNASEALASLEQAPPVSVDEAFDIKGQTESIKKAGEEWVSDLNKEVANIKGTFTYNAAEAVSEAIQSVYGSGPNAQEVVDNLGIDKALDNSTFFKQAVNAYATLDYLQDRYADNQSKIQKISDDVLNAEGEQEKAAALRELETLKARNKYIEEYIKENVAVLNKYSEEVHGVVDGLTYTENPDETDTTSININKAKDALKLVDDKIITSQIKSIDDVSDYVVQKYSDEIDDIKKIVEKDGEISYEKLVSDFPNVISTFEMYGGRFGLTADNITDHINQMFAKTEEEATISNTIKDLMANNYLASDSYKTLSTAMTEQQKAGTISMETYQKLIESDEKLANALALTADGYALNSDAVNEYIQTKTDEQRIQALLAYDEQTQKLEELKKKYEELSNATTKTNDVITELAQNKDAQDAAERDMEAIAAYIRELDAATSALTRFKAAQSSANKDANFQETSKVYNVIKEGNKTGKRNTDDYKSAVDYVLGDNWQEDLNNFGGSVEKARKHAEQVSKRYSGQKDERTGATNFMKDLDKNGFGTYDSKTGRFELTEDTSLDDMSKKMQMSKEYLIDMFNLLNTYSEEGQEFTFPEMFSEKDKEDVAARKKALEENEKSQEQLGDKITDVNKQIEEANKSGDEKETQRLEQRKKKLEESQKTLEQQHTEIESGAELNVDTMTLEDAKKKIDELSETIRTLKGEGISIPVYLPAALDVLLNKFPQFINQIEENPLPTIEVNAQDNASETLNEVTTAAGEVPTETNTEAKVDNSQAIPEMEVVKDELLTLDNTNPQSDVTVNGQQAIPEMEVVHDELLEIDNTNPQSDVTVNNSQAIPEMEVVQDKLLTLDEEEAKPDVDLNDTNFNSKVSAVDKSVDDLIAKPRDSIKINIELSEEAKAAAEELRKYFENPQPVAPEPELKETDKSSTTSFIPEMDVVHDEVIGVETIATDPEEPINQVQNVANGTPIEFTIGDANSVGTAVDALQKKALAAGVDNTEAGGNAIDDLSKAYANLYQAMEKAQSVEIGDTSGADQAANELQTAASEFVTAYNNLSSMTSSLTVDPIEVDADTETALQKVQAIGKDGVTIDVKADTSSAESSIDSLSNKVVTITVQTNTPEFAKGTKNAPSGMSLVDEKGAELIEHTRRGTYELGTNNGPRFTNLEKGDVVHTASETKKILSRMSAIGGFFRDGLNQAKSILTGGAYSDGKNVVTSGSAAVNNSSSKKKSSSKKSSKKKSSSKSSKVNMKKLQAWAEKLFDWAEIRLERLQRATDNFIASAAESIGYVAQNIQLNNAMSNVEKQIKDTTAAYNLYMSTADKVAKKAKLSADIVQKIQNGTIDVSSYNKDMQTRINLYKEWLDKALDCRDALYDLREQQRELSKQRLDNIISHYTNRANVYENIVKQREAQMNLAEAQGREQFASDYNTSITATNNKLNTLVQERTALNNEFNSLVAKGYIKKDSDEWFEYSEKIRDLDTEIITVKNDIIDLHDAANQVALTKLSYQLDQLANSASHVDEMINLHSAQAIDEYTENYKTLIDNGMDQIKNLQAQNAEYRKQQQGLDKMSAKYQELEQSIQSNITAINQMKVSQEGWNDSVYDIQIGKINDFKDQLSKTNELYERQKSLQEAIQELEKARSQRTQRVFHAGGTGFVYEADQEAVKDAQESLEDVIQDELMSKMDDLIDALEEQKDNNNIYDANGNLLGTQYVIPQLDNLSEILSNYYSNPNNAPSVDAIRKLFMDELVSNSNTSNSNQASINIGDIIIQEAENGNDLANAIINQLPNALLQALYKKS